MFVVCAIVSVLLAVMLLASAGAKLVKAPPVVQNLGAIGVPLAWFPRLAVLEILGAIGLIVGLFAPPIGVAAAIGVLCYFAAALSFHVRAGDRNLAPPLVFFVLAVVALITRLGSW
jgi:uncharacterized membrane protein YphA (DoxX/SURF4 family)